ncbi:hypothetical protein EIP91_006613 [Steccherinum ochraceum]|uniref:Yeast cell wall synthesis Kre9/Knh1-like N-terminal domain-containing protein n=1 Tax=Steccherinum ochraceum TaxID=92696 RepID=A0A4R0RDS7_9APHY|nr:hypothetical protein EIP91_006613 [Steccherinum ochraceum]
MTPAMESSINALLNWFNDEPSLWQGRVFSAGADLVAWRKMARTSEGQVGEIDRLIQDHNGFGSISRRMMAKPMIAAVNGSAYGGGTEMVLNCDIVVASEEATFQLPEVKRGVVAVQGGMPRVGRIAGHQLASEMLLTGRAVSAHEAYSRFGFVNKVVPKAQVLATALEFARQINANSPDAVQSTKRALILNRQKADVEEVVATHLRSAESRRNYASENIKGGFADKRHMEETIVHELVHMYDQCRFKVDWDNLRHHACSEIRANALSGDCRYLREIDRGHFSFSKHFQACNKMLALYSAVAFLASYVSATIVISTPTNATSDQSLTVTWTSQMGDPSSFSMELSNPNVFHQALAVGNNLDTSLGTLTFTMSTVPADNNYMLQAVNISNINQVFGQSGTFAISVVTTTSSATTSSGSSSGSSTPALTSSGSTSTSTTPFGTTVSQTSTPSNGQSSGQSSGSSSASSPASTPFNGSGSGNDATGSIAFNWVTLALTGAAAVFGGVLAL